MVKRIFDMCMERRGPQQITNQLKADKVLTPTAYKKRQGQKTPYAEPENPYEWRDSSVVNILERREYTGCTVNFKTYTNSCVSSAREALPCSERSDAKQPGLQLSGLFAPQDAQYRVYPV